MKRRKKQTSTAGQLSLFEVAPVRQEEETRRAPRRKPVGALKPVAPISLPPAPAEAAQTPKNSLKTKMPDRDELNRLWKENPKALHALNRMKEINPYVITLVQAFSLVPQENINR